MARVERWVRERLQQLSARLLLPESPATRDGVVRVPDPPYRVLMLRYDVIGDLVLTTGIMRRIAASAPGIAIDVLARASAAPVLQHLPFVNRVIPFDFSATRRYPSPALLAAIRRERYDVVIDGMSLRDATPTSSVLFQIASRARYRIGLRSARNAYLYTVPVDHDPARHHVEQCAALAIPFGADPSDGDWRPELVCTEAERTRALARWSSLGAGVRLFVNVTTADARRDWPDDRLAEVIRRVHATRPDVRPLLTGAPDQAARIERLATSAGAAWSTQPLREALALIATSDAVLTPDTGVIHMASAFGRPTVSLHRRTMWMWTPYRVPSRVVFSDSDRSLASIGIGAVVRALEELLDEQGYCVAAVDPNATPTASSTR